MKPAFSPEDIACCGLNCSLCHLTTILPQAAQRLKEVMDMDHWEYFGEQLYPQYNGFRAILEDLARKDETCPKCIGGCGNPECPIRICCRARGYQLCALCPDYPCEHINRFLEGRYNFLDKSNRRVRKIGLEAWLEEQATLVEQGYCFSRQIEENE